MSDDATGEVQGGLRSENIARSSGATVDQSGLASTVNMDERHTTNGLSISYPTSVSIAIDPVALITTECITITSAMRKHARWAHSSVSTILGGSPNPSTSSFQTSRPGTPSDDRTIKREARIRPLTAGDDDGGSLASRWGLRGKKGKSMQDNPLMAGFAGLRREIADCKGRISLIRET